MKMTRRRYWVFLLLFLFNAIAYVDRVNMSVAGKPIAHEFGLSPIALGYLFSSFLWAYVLMMLPGGRLIDRWGTHVVASVATAVWSAAQMATGIAGSFATMLVARLGLGVGEAPFAPVTYGSVRSWSPYRERGTAIAAISAGPPLGLALGAPAVGWLIETLSWRWSFVITGAVGFVWVVVWLSLVSSPGKDPVAAAGASASTFWPSATPASSRRAMAASAIWGLSAAPRCGGCSSPRAASSIPSISTCPGCRITYRRRATCRSSARASTPRSRLSLPRWSASSPTGLATGCLSAEAVRSGKRRYLVALCLLLTAVGLAIPFVQPLVGVMALVTVAVSFANVGPAANGALVADILRSPADAGRAFAFLVLGGNTFGLLAPIVTGYIVAATGSFNSAFAAAGVLALIGAVAALALARGTLGEHPARPLAAPRLAD